MKKKWKKLLTSGFNELMKSQTCRLRFTQESIRSTFCSSPENRFHVIIFNDPSNSVYLKKKRKKKGMEFKDYFLKTNCCLNKFVACSKVNYTRPASHPVSISLLNRDFFFTSFTCVRFGTIKR